jgi:hypothetical protein
MEEDGLVEFLIVGQPYGTKALRGQEFLEGVAAGQLASGLE